MPGCGLPPAPPPPSPSPKQQLRAPSEFCKASCRRLEPAFCICLGGGLLASRPNVEVRGSCSAAGHLSSQAAKSPHLCALPAEPGCGDLPLRGGLQQVLPLRPDARPPLLPSRQILQGQAVQEGPDGQLRRAAKGLAENKSIAGWPALFGVESFVHSVDIIFIKALHY